MCSRCFVGRMLLARRCSWQSWLSRGVSLVTDLNGHFSKLAEQRKQFRRRKWLGAVTVSIDVGGYDGPDLRLYPHDSRNSAYLECYWLPARSVPTREPVDQQGWHHLRSARSVHRIDELVPTRQLKTRPSHVFNEKPIRLDR